MKKTQELKGIERGVKFGRYTIVWDGICWTLATGLRPRKDPTQSPRLLHPSYHATLRQVARRLVDFECGKALDVCSTLEEVMTKVEKTLQEIVAKEEKKLE